MLLNELFDETYKVDTRVEHDRTGETWIAEFVTDDKRPYSIEITPQSDGGAVIAFFARNGDEESIRPTGLGDAYKIFATIMELMKAYAEKTQPTYVGFSADNTERSRVALYKRMLRTMVPPGYAVEVLDAGEMTDFFINRI